MNYTDDKYKPLDFVVIGAGLYVCGKVTSGFRTILPEISKWERHNNDIHCDSNSAKSSKELLQKAEGLEIKTGIKVDIKKYKIGELAHG
jgi:hypothetical protein